MEDCCFVQYLSNPSKAYKLITILCLVIYILTWLQSYPLYSYIAQPRALIQDFDLRPLFLFPFHHLGFGHLAFSLVSFNYFSEKIESKIGSGRFFVSFIVNNFLIGLMTSICIYSYAEIWSTNKKLFRLYPVAGLWPFNMVLMVKYFGHHADDKTGFIFMPFNIRAKWYPVCFFVFWLLTVKFVWEIGVGIVVGYCSKRYLDVDLVVEWGFRKIQNSQLATRLIIFISSLKEKHISQSSSRDLNIKHVELST